MGATPSAGMRPARIRVRDFAARVAHPFATPVGEGWGFRIFTFESPRLRLYTGRAPMGEF
jgi:hypothetical protein